ncbi:oligosaccharide flippase family protein [Gemmatimonas aurantiaca]|nr:oligosaccharide flippase family protein [Gemmatimonas aurantiaca]
MSIGKQLLRNIFSSWASFGLRVVITFFFTPFITSELGGARYGVWVILFATLDYLSMADMGMKQALVRFISKALGKKDFDEVNRTLNTANAIYLVLALLVFALALLVINNLGTLVSIPDVQLLEEAQGALFVIALHLVTFFVLMPFASTLGAFHRFDLSNAQMVVEEVVRVFVLVWLLLNGYGLVSLAWAIYLTSLARQFWSMLVLKRLHPEVRLQIKSVDRSMAKRLLGYSKISFLIVIMWLVIFRADAYLLGGLLTVSAAGIYAPASQLFHYIRNLINAVGTPLVPAISHLEATESLSILKEIYLKGIKYIAFIVTVFSVGCLFFARDFVRLWLSPDFAPAGDVMMILAVPAIVFLPQIIGNSILFGIEKHKHLLYVLIAEAALKIILSIALIDQFGLLGIAYGSAIPQLLLYGLVYPHIMKRTIGVSVSLMYVRLFKSILLAGLLSAPLCWLLQNSMPPITWTMFFVDVFIVLAVSAPGALWLLEADDRVRLREMFKRD